MDNTKIPKSLGEHLRKEIGSHNKTDFARRIGISRKQLYNLLDDKSRLTLDVARSLGEATGKGAKHWLQLEFDHRIYSNGIR